MSANEAQGVLGIWHSVRPGREAEFEHWYHHEHFLERIGVPGFRRGRRYEAVRGKPDYFCYYLTDTPEVLQSAAYLERLNNPTPLTRTMMLEVFTDMVRTACRRERVWNRLDGAFAVTVRFSSALPAKSLEGLATRLLNDPGIARCELWSAAEQGPVAREEQLRGGDKKITGCMLVDAVRLPDAERALAEVQQLAIGAEIAIYRLLSEIQ